MGNLKNSTFGPCNFERLQCKEFSIFYNETLRVYINAFELDVYKFLGKYDLRWLWNQYSSKMYWISRFSGKITLFPFPKMGMLKIDYFNVTLIPYEVLWAPVQSNSLDATKRCFLQYPLKPMTAIREIPVSLHTQKSSMHLFHL